MVDDRDDEIFELTEDMASAPPPADSEGEEQPDEAARASVPPPRPSSPFMKIADPKPAKSKKKKKAKAKKKKAKETYTPRESAVPVVTAPIKVLATDNRPVETTLEETEEPLETVDKAPVEEQVIELTTPVQDEEEILDLGQEMIAAEGQEEPVNEEVVVLEDTTSVLPDSVEAEEAEEKPETEVEADLGTPEAVFDTFEEEVEPPDEGTDDFEEGEDINLGGMEEIPEKDAAIQEPPGEEEDSEEIDLVDVEEVTEPKTSSAVRAKGHAPPSARRPKLRRKRKRRKEWWEDIFDDDYLSLIPKKTNRELRREVDAIEKGLNAKKGSLILDLACGDGRHAVGLSRRGYRMVGVDLSLPMLARAGEAAQGADQKINFIHGDMRDLGFYKTFDGVYCVGTSFGYFDEQTNLKVLQGIHRALKPGAPFYLEVANRDHAISDQPNLTWFEGQGSICMEETTVNYLNSRLNVVRQLIMGDNARSIKHEISIRLYSLHELGAIFTDSGFKVSRVSGNNAAPGAFFGVDSPLIIISASRRR